MLNIDVRERSKLSIDVRQRGSVMVLDLAGRLHLGQPAQRLTDKVNSLLHQGHRRFVINLELVRTMDTEGFGNCSNEYECEAVCPKEVKVSNIARMNREFLLANFFGKAEPKAPAARLISTPDVPEEE